ncbi:MAG: hypothetical protein J6O40_04855 [Ruminococcus sp.]|nr:hypothetical protein [Ruminococcus sp.]
MPKKKYDLVLVARNEGKLYALKNELEKQYHITARSEVGVKEICKKNERINRHYDHIVRHFVILWFGD